jgi:hypothetical protein
VVRRLFGGRDDVYALRWENVRTGKSGYVPAVVGGWSRQGPKTYLPLSQAGTGMTGLSRRRSQVTARPCAARPSAPAKVVTISESLARC